MAFSEYMNFSNNPKNDQRKNKYSLSQLVRNPFSPPVFTVYKFDKFYLVSYLCAFVVKGY